ncbi:hypothetical protein CSPX01_07901 [Colletotrichum filicis]|nr:hypothetical protein CSPX01_07901 [Colletotrichum filicis]
MKGVGGLISYSLCFEEGRFVSRKRGTWPFCLLTSLKRLSTSRGSWL